MRFIFYNQQQDIIPIEYHQMLINNKAMDGWVMQGPGGFYRLIYSRNYYPNDSRFIFAVSRERAATLPIQPEYEFFECDSNYIKGPFCLFIKTNISFHNRHQIHIREVIYDMLKSMYYNKLITTIRKNMKSTVYSYKYGEFIIDIVKINSAFCSDMDWGEFNGHVNNLLVEYIE